MFDQRGREEGDFSERLLQKAANKITVTCFSLRVQDSVVVITSDSNVLNPIAQKDHRPKCNSSSSKAEMQGLVEVSSLEC